MANEALEFYGNRARELDAEFMENGGKLAGFMTRRFTCVTSTQQSKDVTRSMKSGHRHFVSGMATGGRVLHYLRATLPIRATPFSLSVIRPPAPAGVSWWTASSR